MPSRVIQGLAVKAIALGLALYVGVTVYGIVTHTFAQVNAAFAQVQK